MRQPKFGFAAERFNIMCLENEFTRAGFSTFQKERKKKKQSTCEPPKNGNNRQVSAYYFLIFIIIGPVQWRLDRSEQHAPVVTAARARAMLAAGSQASLVSTTTAILYPYAFDIAITTACTSTRPWLRGHGERTSQRRQ